MREPIPNIPTRTVRSDCRHCARDCCWETVRDVLKRLRKKSGAFPCARQAGEDGQPQDPWDAEGDGQSPSSRIKALRLANRDLRCLVKELAEANNYLEHLFESTEVATLFLNRELRALRCTPSALELLPLSADGKLPSAADGFAFPGLDIALEARRVLETGRRIVTTVGAGDGRWFEARLTPFRSLEGETDGMVLTLVDITSVQQAKDVLRKANEELEARVEERTGELLQAKAQAEEQAASRKLLARVARELAFAHDLETVMRIVRLAARQLSGADGATFVLREGDVCHYAEEDAIQPLWKGQRFPMHACISGWVMLRGETAVIEDITKDPRIPQDAYRPTFVKSLVMVPVRREDPVAAIGNYWAAQGTPEPERVRLLESLADLTSVALENVRLYGELTARAEELLAQKELAEDATRAKSQFLANMSHEIRTPMNGVLGLTELALMEDDLPPRSREYLQMVKQSGLNLLAIINDILDFSKIEARKIELDSKAFDPRLLVESALAPLALAATNKGLAFSVNVAPDVPALLAGDQGRLLQILTNLVGNAVKFTERGWVRASVGLAREEEDTGRTYLLFTVADTGVGVPTHMQGRIFESFSQADSSWRKEFGGTGLGLAIARSLVEMMGGRIWVESEPGKGAVFSFTAGFASADQPEEPAAPREAAPGGLKPLRILVAEDNKVNQLFMNELLSMQGHHVATVENGRDALARLRQESFDLVLMDVQMPHMDGLEAMRAIRCGQAGPGNAAIPVVALTAHALKSERELLIESGMNAYLAKPIDLDDLSDVLRRFTRDGHRENEGATVR